VVVVIVVSKGVIVVELIVLHVGSLCCSLLLACGVVVEYSQLLNKFREGELCKSYYFIDVCYEQSSSEHGC